jgi:hypothetical protein
MPRPLYPGKEPQYPVSRMLVKSQSLSGRFIWCYVLYEAATNAIVKIRDENALQCAATCRWIF